MEPLLRIRYYTDYFSSVESTLQGILQIDLVKRVADFAILLISKIAIVFNFFPDQSKELNHKFNALFGLLTVIGFVFIAVFGRNQKSLIIPATPTSKKQRNDRADV